MLIIYFSGTGNTKYIAKKFAKEIGGECFSIEDDIDYKSAILKHDTICLCYPIHYSLPPVIFKEFIEEHYDCFKDKKIISLCTQQMFSGDGAMSVTRYLPECTVIYAMHFNMPNNIGCIPLWSKLTKREFSNCRKISDLKIEKMVEDISLGKKVLKGKGAFARLLGKTQNYNEGKKGVVKVSDECILCDKCIKGCPTKTLFNDGKTILNDNNCTNCFRCVNICPTKAITVLIHRKSSIQYDVRKEVDSIFDI